MRQRRNEALDRSGQFVVDGQSMDGWTCNAGKHRAEVKKQPDKAGEGRNGERRWAELVRVYLRRWKVVRLCWVWHTPLCDLYR